jgi:hypothetical protein
MRAQNSSTKRDALWKRYWSIKDEHGCGLYVPILWHLALGGDFSAMVTLADTFVVEGRIAEPFSRAGLYYRAHRGGYEYAAQHLAMDAFNRGDLASYRYWLRRAVRFDPDHLKQLKRFETRLPHQTAHDRGRGRPYRPYD